MEIKLNTFWINNKNGKTYYVKQLVVNTTNAQDGQKMVEYECCDDRPKLAKDVVTYVRSEEEFLQKFKEKGNEPIIGICDFCGEGDVLVKDVGQMGYRMAGFSSCQKCEDKVNKKK